MDENQGSGRRRHLQLPHSGQNADLRARGGGQHHHWAWRRWESEYSDVRVGLNLHRRPLFLTIRLFCLLKEPRALLESPLFLATALPSRCIGPAAIKAVHQSHDTSSRPDPPVSHFTTHFWLLRDDYSFLRPCIHIYSSSCLSDEGLWDILIKDIPKEVTSYTLNLEMLREGVTYDFRVIAVNDYGYGSPSAPSPSISGTLNVKKQQCYRLVNSL